MKEGYHQTQFVTGLEGASSPDHFFIITAHNPFGEVAPDEKNDEKNALLLEAIQASKWRCFPITGQCEDHAEAGFGVVCSRAEAIALGKQFRQDAIYEICDDQVVLVDCQETEADEMVGTWSKLQAPTL
ncbi:MAG: DUF3293 domain-containing protein [Akkermansiaceae bacterium]|nr:DUF3293 domain-containing protein [Akkermansiaceae bacterium]